MLAQLRLTPQLTRDIDRAFSLRDYCARGLKSERNRQRARKIVKGSG